MNTFSDFPLLPAIQKSLEMLGFTKPTEVQAKVIPKLLEDPKQDVHAQAQTGTGKTLAFGIPLLQVIDPSLKAVQGLIIAPTRELVLQIYESLKDVSRNTNIIIEPIYGGMPINRQITNIKRGAQIIVGTPGRLNDHLRRKTLTLSSLKVLVLDEADIMLDMGFKEEINSVLEYAPKNRNIWLFSATVLPGIKQLIKSHMKDVLSVRAAEKDILAPQVKQYYCVVPMRQRTEALARFIEAAPDFYGIVFCRTKDLTNQVMEELASKGFKANCLHGDMRQALRNQVIKGFKNKDFNILIATDVAARGIDVSDLTHVINYSIPDEMESYIHRIGRTGRAGKEGIAIVFVSGSELHKIRRLEKIARTNLQEVPVPPLDAIINAKMGAVSDFIEQSKKPDSKLSRVHEVVKELINSFSEDEVKNSLAVALEDKFFKDIIHEDLKRVSADVGPQEICMELGQQSGLDEDIVRNYLYQVCKVLPQEVTKVRVLKEKTFISIPENRLRDCIGAMQSTPISTESHKVYLVEDVYREKRKKPTRPRPDKFKGERRRDERGRKGRGDEKRRGRRR
ncbi:MAG: DEAD/DEAH box helicase [Candidatus Babeliales bacterium]